MFNTDAFGDINQLVNKLKEKIVIFDNNIDNLIANAESDEDKTKLEKVKANIQKSISLAKMGKSQESIELINKLINEHKGNPS